MLAGGCVAWGNGHAEIGARLGEGTYDNGSTVVLFVVVGSLLVGAAALVPSMRRVPDTTPGDERRRVARSGVWLLALAPAVVLVVHVAEIDAGRLWVAVPAMSAIVVAASRTAWLTADLDGTGPATRPAAPDIEADVRPNAAPRHVG